MKPIIKWSGGKRTELDYIKKFLPEDFDLFIEPFVGGGAVYFNLYPKKAIISDTHKDLINFYKQIKFGHQKLIYDLCNLHPPTEEEYYIVRDKITPKNNIEKAFIFYYLRKTAFRGMLRYNSKGHFNIPFGRYKNVDFSNILDKKYHVLLKRTKILNQDFRKIFKTYNDNKNFVFLDPPYDSTFKKYGANDFTKKNHKDLANLFKTTKNKCMLIISDTPFIRELYKKYIKFEYPKKYAFKIYNNRVNSKINKTHLIITNY